MELKTPLYDEHVKLGGKIVEFGGYLLPIQYPTGIIKEHTAVRTKAGLFDVSHMGEVVFKGKDALKNINYIFTNDFTNMYTGQVRYSVMCYKNGGCVDDLIVYKIDDETYFVVVNASNRLKDVEWIRKHISGDVEFSDISDSVAQIALQGPESDNILKELVCEEYIPIKYYSFKKEVYIGDIKALISRTGYTGENGFEIYISNDDAPTLWNLLLKTGEKYGLIPCALGARDTLRLEAGMPLYGHEMNENVTPLETNLSFAVKTSKNFIGRDAIINKENSKSRVGLKVVGRGIAREHQDIYKNGKLIGQTSSGTFCPFIKYSAAMALVSEKLEVGEIVEIDIRGNKIAAEVVPLPFYKKS